MQWLLVCAGLVVVGSAVLGALGFRGRQQVVGIDLGTTFSVVAIKKGDEITVLPDRISGKVLVPSVVTFHPNGSTLVGSQAVQMRGSYPQHTIFNAKRFIGRPYRECEEDAAHHPYRVAPNATDSSEESVAGFLIPGVEGEKSARWYSAREVGSEVVKHMGRSVEAFLGYTIRQAVICVPAKFAWPERKATVEAFERAGFKVTRVLEEPTAAAIAYNLHKGSGIRHVLVYDIGGGTLDTSLLFMNGRAVSVLGVAGDDHLGGSDFDQRMADLLLELVPDAPIVEASGTISGINKCDRTGLLIAGEDAKIQLSSVFETEVVCLHEDGLPRTMKVTRKQFEDASSDLFSRSMQPVAKVLEDQMMTSDDVDDVVLVGGASRIPKLRELLQEFVGTSKQLHTEIDPDITVAYGAANILD